MNGFTAKVITRLRRNRSTQTEGAVGNPIIESSADKRIEFPKSPLSQSGEIKCVTRPSNSLFMYLSLKGAISHRDPNSFTYYLAPTPKYAKNIALRFSVSFDT